MVTFLAHAGLHAPELAALAGGVLLPFLILTVVIVVTQRRDRRQGLRGELRGQRKDHGATSL
jgi:hypothetical protein